MTTQDTNVDRAAKLDTATLSDALDKLGIIGQCYKIKPRDTDFRMAGRAWTLKYGPAGKPCGTVGDYIDDVAPGSVIVLDNNGRDDCTVWGDILTEIAHRRGIAGTVINGINRDTHLCLSLGYPIFSKDSWMRTGKDRVEVAEVEGPVTIGGVKVQPGDMIVGDSDGVVAIPQDCELEVLEIAEMIEEREEGILQAVLAGSTIAEARAKFGYHLLQRGDSK